MKKLLLTILTLLWASTSFALTMDWVTIGNPGNSDDVHYDNYGAVEYEYCISIYEVTNTQFVVFLNAVAATDPYGLYNENMGASVHGGITRSGSSGNYSYSIKDGYELKPVVYVSWNDCARFINWLNSGNTETGAYDMSKTHPTRLEGALYWLPTEDEWYKAAYYDPTLNNNAGGYWDFPTQSESIDTANVNYDNSVGTVTDVGSYDNDSYYGTYDQSGNVYEWNETLIAGAYRGFRGGSFGCGPNLGLNHLSANSCSVPTDSTTESYDIGFRVAASSEIIPEPVSIGLLITSLIGLFIHRRKRN